MFLKTKLLSLISSILYHLPNQTTEYHAENWMICVSACVVEHFEGYVWIQTYPYEPT